MADFKYVEFITTGENLLSDLTKNICNNFPTSTDALLKKFAFNATAGETEVENTWKMVDSTYKTGSTTIMSEVVYEVTTKIGTTDTKKFYVKLKMPFFTDAVGVTPTNHSTMYITQMENYDETAHEGENVGYPVLFEWAKEDYTESGKKTDRTIKSPVYVYLNVSRNRLAMVLVADPAVHFKDYRKSFAYIGAVKPFADLNEFDVDGNFLVTAGTTAAEPTDHTVASADGAIHNYGMYTSFGNTTLQMFRTRSGIMHQKHYPSFITQAPSTSFSYTVASGGTGSNSGNTIGVTGLDLEPQGFNASNWTRKYHLSPVYIVHPYDGYRGSMEGVIAVSKNNILHQDELIVDVVNKPQTQEIYKFFDHDSEYNFMAHSANIKMGVAILKEYKY